MINERENKDFISLPTLATGVFLSSPKYKVENSNVGVVYIILIRGYN